MDALKTKPSKKTSTDSGGFVEEAKKFLIRAGEKIGEGWRGVKRCIRNAWHDFLRSFARWADPRLEPYREHRLAESKNNSRPEKVVVQEEIYTPAEPEPPKTREDLFALIREAPMNVLNGQERKAMTAVLGLPDVLVSEIMTIESKMVFVEKEETLGPLMLDKLYRSGFIFFPVVEGNRRIIGTLQTTLLNSLDVKDTHKTVEVMDPRVYYIRSDYSLEQALKAFLRTGSQLMMVVDRYEKLVGMLTFAQIMDYLFDEKFKDGFDRDSDRLAVAKRRD